MGEWENGGVGERHRLKLVTRGTLLTHSLRQSDERREPMLLDLEARFE